MPKFQDVSVTKDNILFKEGDIADKVYIITDGDFIVTKRTVSNSRV